MELSIRLEAIAACVKPGLRIADIGTDHGYLPIELIRRGICPQALACDVRRGPLERAREHIREAGLDDRISTRLSDGLERILPGEAESCVIAGMGGRLIQGILEAESRRNPNVLQEIKQLILQPQSDWETVRKAVHNLSFHIENESMVIDRDKYYWILVCEPGQEVYERSWQYRYGKILTERRDPVLHRYLLHKYSKNDRLLCSLAGSESEAAGARRIQLQIEQTEIKEVLALWN